MNSKVYIILFSALLLVVSCDRQNEIKNADLLKAEKLMDSNPEKSVAILANLNKSSLTDSSDIAAYVLLKVQLADKNNAISESDSMIKVAVKYYDQNGSDLQRAKAHYLFAQYYLQMKQIVNAVDQLYLALPYVEKTDYLNYIVLVKGDLGELLSSNGFYREADDLFTELYQLQKKKKDYSHMALTLLRWGNNYLYSADYNKAKQLIKQADRMTRQYPDKVMEEHILFSLSNLYSKTKEWRLAVDAALEGSSMNSDNERYGFYCLVLEEAYNGLQKYDSASYYVDKRMQTNPAMISSVYVFKNNGNNRIIVNYREYQGSTFFISRDSNTTSGIRNLISSYNSKSTKLSSPYLTVLFALLLLALLFFIIMFFRKHSKRLKEEKDKLLQTNSNMGKLLEEHLQKEKELSNQVSNLIKNNSYNDFKKTDIYQKLIKIAVYNYNNPDSLNEIDDSLWEEMNDTIQRATPDFVNELKSQYGIENVDELHFCSLLHIGFSYVDIAKLYGCTKQAVYKKRDLIIKNTGIESREKFLEMFTGN